MPFTPFHFGPGVALKALAPSYYSFSVFVFVQILIDIEPLYYMLHGEWPVHRFFHTYLGATLVAIAGFLLGRPLCGVFLMLLQNRLRPTRQCFVDGFGHINNIAALSGAFIGSYSHVALDSIMHIDVQPFVPFSTEIIIFNSITVMELHVYCTIAGVVGAIGMGFWWMVWQERR
ncbi:MAG: DUF4184 domain-containing protein [Candidatus Thiodiazotropha sp. (ex Codakia rugifera)]|nr:DUF4184 domain-containing protein [Candidatus Thiodiazotropha sp. (ex Codakia rugifera)]